ncbi:hypothetical protein D3C80_2039680 [compost metagenome]
MPLFISSTAIPLVKLLVSRINVEIIMPFISIISAPVGPPSVFKRRTAKVANKVPNKITSVIRNSQKPNCFNDS